MIVPPHPGPYYMAHPYGGDTELNVARAYRWLAWLMAMEPDRAIFAPWLPFADYLRLDGPAAAAEPSDSYGARCLRDDVLLASHMNRIILCGGRLSSGMAAELHAVQRNGGIVCDLLDLGDEPPLRWDHAVGPVEYGEAQGRCPS